MNIESFKNVNIYIAEGENNFTMSRGSFRYKEKIQHKRRLMPVLGSEGPASAAGTSDSNVKLFKDPLTGREYIFKLDPDNSGRLHFRLDDTPVENPHGKNVEASQTVNRFWLEIPTDKNEHYYGCGETFSEFDLKGQTVRIWTAEHQNTKRISHKIIRDKLTGKHPDRKLKFDKYESYYVQPTFVGALSEHGLSNDKPHCYYLHANTKAFCTFDFSSDGIVTLYIQDRPDIYFETAASFPSLSEKLSRLLGRQDKLPDWIYDGLILASQEGTESIEKKIKLAEKYDIPLAGFWSQDWCGCRRTGFGYQVMWNWEWDRDLYPDLDIRIKEWRTRGIRMLGYINPFLALEKDLYKYAAEHDYCVKARDGKDYLVTITTFPAAMIDLTNPKAYEWYKSIIKKNMIDLGLSGWMADFGEYLPTDCILHDGSDPEMRHNEWPALWARLNREVIDESGKNDIFFFTRAGFTDTVRYSSLMWNGDQHVDFSADDGIGSVIPATLSLAMSGFGITHSDTGGYTTIMNMTRTKELLMRWEELNTFSPLMRFHEGNQPSRNIQFDSDGELLEHLSLFAHIHVALRDYIKQCVSECAETGAPVMRPVFYHYDEPWAYGESSEYLLGRDILVAPVLKEGAVSRTVHLPQDKWIHFFTKKEYDCGEYTVDAPVGCPPVFIRKSCIEKFPEISG